MPAARSCERRSASFTAGRIKVGAKALFRLLSDWLNNPFNEVVGVGA